jgi:hypothetical protein
MDAARPPNQRPAPPHVQPLAPPHVQPLAPPQYQPPAPRPYPQHAREDDGQSDAAGDAATAASRRGLPAHMRPPSGQRQEGEAGTGNDDRVLARELHAGHLGCEVRIIRGGGRDALAGVLAAVHHRHEMRAGDSVVRTELTVRWGDESLVQVAVEASEVLSIHAGQSLR